MVLFNYFTTSTDSMTVQSLLIPVSDDIVRGLVTIHAIAKLLQCSLNLTQIESTTLKFDHRPANQIPAALRHGFRCRGCQRNNQGHANL